MPKNPKNPAARLAKAEKTVAELRQLIARTNAAHEHAIRNRDAMIDQIRKSSAGLLGTIDKANARAGMQDRTIAALRDRLGARSQFVAARRNRMLRALDPTIDRLSRLATQSTREERRIVFETLRSEIANFATVQLATLDRDYQAHEVPSAINEEAPRPVDAKAARE